MGYVYEGSRASEGEEKAASTEDEKGKENKGDKEEK